MIPHLLIFLHFILLLFQVNIICGTCPNGRCKGLWVLSAGNWFLMFRAFFSTPLMFPLHSLMETSLIFTFFFQLELDASAMSLTSLLAGPFRIPRFSFLYEGFLILNITTVLCQWLLNYTTAYTKLSLRALLKNWIKSRTIHFLVSICWLWELKMQRKKNNALTYKSMNLWTIILVIEWRQIKKEVEYE